MRLSVYTIAIKTYAPVLRTLSEILDKAAEHAGPDADALGEARLAPDMFPLVKQVQIACDHAKNGTARLMGKEAPRFEDDEKTLAELKARIARTLDYLDSASPSDFEGAEERHLSIPLFEGHTLEMNGTQYLRDWSLPNFYFHVVTAYDILRANGAPIGKRDYLAHAGYAIHERAQTA